MTQRPFRKFWRIGFSFSCPLAHRWKSKAVLMAQWSIHSVNLRKSLVLGTSSNDLLTAFLSRIRRPSKRWWRRKRSWAEDCWTSLDPSSSRMEGPIFAFRSTNSLQVRDMVIQSGWGGKGSKIAQVYIWGFLKSEIWSQRKQKREQKSQFPKRPSPNF